MDSLNIVSCKERTVILYPDCFHPPIRVTFDVPEDVDEEAYIDAYLDSILSMNVRLNTEWEFEE